jgi:hypothetical protein
MEVDMLLSNVLLGIAFTSIAWSIVSSLVITDALQKRGVKINWIFLRIMIIKYIGQYRDVTRKETGRTGPWFYSYIIAVNVALATVIVGLILRST